MNRLQFLLLKIIEESGEIASELLEHGLAQKVHLEIDDLEAVVRLFGSEFNTFTYLNYRSVEKKQLAMVVDGSKDFWTLKLQKACLDLSKIAGKCMQFGLMERQAELQVTNLSRLADSVLELYNCIQVLNQEFEFSYTFNEERIKLKNQKIQKYHDYSVELGLVTTDPVPQDQYPLFAVFLDESNYFAHYDRFIPSEAKTAICLPIKADETEIKS